MSREEKEDFIRQNSEPYAWLMEQTKYERYLRRQNQSDEAYDVQKAEYDMVLDLLVWLIRRSEKCEVCERLEEQLKILHIQAGSGVENWGVRSVLWNRLYEHRREAHPNQGRS